MKRQKQASRYLRVATLAYKVTQAVLPLYRHANSPKVYTQPQLVASVLLKVYLNLSWRDLEDWLLTSDQVCAVLELEQVPDHTTLYRTFQHLPMAVLRSLNHTLLRWLGVSESVMLVDATGFSPTQASTHYRSVSGRTMPSANIKSHWFDNIGDTFDYTYEVNDETLTIWGGEKGSPAYYKGKWSDDGNTNSGGWVYPDGGGYKSTMTRIK
ncbi:MAG: hypothetical protein ABI690_35150 [Chloroflexota bacterium]